MSECDELRKVAEAATPGPWLRNPDDRCEVLAEAPDPMFPDFPFDFVITDCNGQASVSEQNFAHIVAFNPSTALALLARIAELEAKVARVSQVLLDGCYVNALQNVVVSVDAVADALASDSDE